MSKRTGDFIQTPLGSRSLPSIIREKRAKTSSTAPEFRSLNASLPKCLPSL